MELPTKMLLVMLIAFGGLLLSSAAPPPTFTEKLDVTQQHPTEATYRSFMTRLDSAVKRTTKEFVEMRPLLGKQKLTTTPDYWVNVELTDAAGQRLLTLALRSDNLDVSGFANRHGEWFAFKGQQATLPGSRALSYAGDYADIFGGWHGLATVQVNRAKALANALLLADYRSGPDTGLKPALGFFILTIAEAERFPTLRAALARAMDDRTPQTMSQSLVRLAVNWKSLSCALRAWVLHEKTMDAWNGNTEAIDLRTEIGVNTPEEALAVIQPMLRSIDCTWTPPPPQFTESLDVTQQHPTEATYLNFMMRLDSAVKRTTTESVLEHPLLGEQKLWATPAYWVNVELTDADGKRLLTLALRSDNLYVFGFANRHGEWFAFKDDQIKLPGWTALSYTSSYADIFGPGVGWRGLATVQVNRAKALANALLLADYRSGPDTGLKPALGFFILTIAEAERFPTLHAALASAMDKQKPQKMSQSLVKLAVNWKRLSCALRAWVLRGKTMAAWNANTEAIQLRTEINVNTPEEALARIQPMLRSKGCTWTPLPPQFIRAE